MIRYAILFQFEDNAIVPHFLKCFENCDAFDDLRSILYIKKGKTLCFRPPTSNMTDRHILRSNYFVLISPDLISAPDSYLNLVEFGWNSVDSLLMPNKYIVTLPEMYNVTCMCKKNCTERWQCSKKFGASSREFCKCNGEECYT